MNLLRFSYHRVDEYTSLKARHLGGIAFCKFHRLGVPEQGTGGILLGFGIVVEDKLSCNWGHFIYTLIWCNISMNVSFLLFSFLLGLA